jgi:hypothetical protein
MLLLSGFEQRPCIVLIKAYANQQLVTSLVSGHLVINNNRAGTKKPRSIKGAAF